MRDGSKLRGATALLIPALLFGFLVTAQWRTQEVRDDLTVRYNVPLTEAAQALQNEQNGLKAEIAELRQRLDEFQQSASQQSDAARDLQARLEGLKDRAGLTPRNGDGVVITFDDAKQVPSGAFDIEKAICHSTDLIDIVNTAWSAEALAIAINDERLVGTSSIYCVGSTIMVNGTLMSPPFRIAAIGPQDLLLAVFEDPEELRDIKQRRDVHGLGFRVARAEGLTVPAFSGPVSVRFATPR
ncbi:MAG: DUF881 domain-containing protein [Candidatus Limnocylindria bacterium]